MSAKLLENIPALCNICRRIAIEAGELTLEYFEDVDMGLQEKGDGSPVTLADQKAEELIEKALKSHLPDVLVIGEEAVAEGRRPDLSDAEYFFLVDPLDGTKEFIAGRPEYTVNIALIHKGEPIMGVVYAPAKGELFAGYYDARRDDYKAIRWSDETGKEREINVRRSPGEGLTVVASKSHGDSSRQDKFLSRFKIAKLMKCGSSLKICAIAAGKADIYPRLGPTCEWDTAAAHAVLRAAGGFLTTLDGVSLRYGGDDPKLLNPEFIACAFNWWDIEDEADA